MADRIRDACVQMMALIDAALGLVTEIHKLELATCDLVTAESVTMLEGLEEGTSLTLDNGYTWTKGVNAEAEYAEQLAHMARHNLDIRYTITITQLRERFTMLTSVARVREETSAPTDR